MKEKMHW